MEKRLGLMIILVMILVLALSACAGTTPQPSSGEEDQNGDQLPPVAAVRAREALATELDVNVEEVTIISHEQTVWQDSCLELGGIAESCMRVDVEGWLVELSANGDTYKAHTDWLGEQVRFEP